MVTRSLDSFYVLMCCFTSSVSSWGHVGTVSYLTTLFLSKYPGGSLPVLSVHSFASSWLLAFLKSAEKGEKIHERGKEGLSWD